MSLVRLVLVLDRNTPRRTSVPSGSCSTWPLGTVREPVRVLYWARAAMPRSKALRGAVEGFAGSFGSGADGGHAKRF